MSLIPKVFPSGERGDELGGAPYYPKNWLWPFLATFTWIEFFPKTKTHTTQHAPWALSQVSGKINILIPGKVLD